MRELYKVNAYSNNMLTIFSKLNQPYRCQSNVCILVPFCEYKKFVTCVSSTTGRLLSFSNEFYLKALKSSESRLKKYYLYDVSSSLLNELTFAIENRKDATILLHEFDFEDTAKTYKYETLQNELASIQQDILFKGMNSLRSDMTLNIVYNDLSEHNKRVYNYAWFIRTMCYIEKPEWVNILIE